MGEGNRVPGENHQTLASH